MIIDHVNCGQPEEYAIRGMYVASICLDFHYERMECTFRPSTPWNLITHVLIICHEKPTQSTYCIGAKRLTLDCCCLHSVTFGYY